MRYRFLKFGSDSLWVWLDDSGLKWEAFDIPLSGYPRHPRQLHVTQRTRSFMGHFRHLIPGNLKDEDH